MGQKAIRRGDGIQGNVIEDCIRLCRRKRLGLDIDGHHACRAEQGGGDAKNAGTATVVEHRASLKARIRQPGQAGSGGGMLPRAEG